MAPERTSLRTPVVVARRSVPAAIAQRHAGAGYADAALQSRASPQAVHAVAVARAMATASAAQPVALPIVVAASGVGPQFLAKVSSPNDPSELEAQNAASKVVKMGVPVAAETMPRSQQTMVQRRAAAPVPVGATTRIDASGGLPLSPAIRGFMEPRFNADFSNVRVHTDAGAAEQSAALSAHAFTVGQHVYFGHNQYQPDTSHGRELIAHELTHTIQQGAAVQRSADAAKVSQRTEPSIQRWGVADALNKVADKVNLIPGFRLLTIVFGMNPVNWAPVERNAANLLRALLEMIPVAGPLIAQALANHGIFVKVGAWVEARVRSLGLVGSALKRALDKFLDTLNWRDIFDLDGVWERAKRIFTEPIDRLIAFGKGLATEVLRFIREAILLPLAKLAEGDRKSVV